MIKIGDTFEHKFADGYKYFQYVFHFDKPPKYGKLFKVFTKLHKKSIGKEYPTNSKDDYFVFVFVGKDIPQTSDLVRITNHSEGTITDYADLPLFRSIQPIFPGQTKPGRYTVDQPGNPDKLFFKELPKEFWKVSTLRLMPIEILLKTIEDDWCPEQEMKNITSGKIGFPY